MGGGPRKRLGTCWDFYPGPRKELEQRGASGTSWKSPVPVDCGVWSPAPSLYTYLFIIIPPLLEEDLFLLIIKAYIVCAFYYNPENMLIIQM